MSNILIGPPGTGALPTASTIDAVNDVLPIYTASATATQGINRNTLLGLSSQPVGLTDTQTLTNKTLSTPVLGVATATSINGLTLTSSTGTLTITNGKTLAVTNSLTLSGTDSTTMIFPSSSDTVVTIRATQTLTNKTLTSPAIGTSILDTNANTLLALTATASAVNYLTLSDSATTTAPTLTATGSDTNINIGLTAKGTGFIKATPPVWQYLGYAQITTNSTIASTSFGNGTNPLAVTVTIPAGTTKVRVTAFASDLSSGTGGDGSILGIWNGTVSGGTQISQYTVTPSATIAIGVGVHCVSISTPSAGSTTFSVGISSITGGTTTLAASSSYPVFILVECC